MKKFFLFCFIFIYFFLTYSPYKQSAEGIVLFGTLCMFLFALFAYFLGIIKSKTTPIEHKYKFESAGIFLIYVLIFLLVISGYRSPFGFDSVLALLAITVTHVFTYAIIVNHYDWNIEMGINYLAIFTLIFGMVAAIVGNIVYWYGNIELGFISIGKSDYYQRAYSWFLNANVFANMLSFSVLSSLFLFLKSDKRKQKVILSVAFISLFLTLLLTGSKAGLLTLIVGIVFLFLSINGFKLSKLLSSRRIYIILFLGIFVFIILSNILDMEYYIDAILRIDNSEQRRFDLWIVGLQFISSFNFTETLLGKGHGYYWFVTGNSTHNTYIELLLNNGVLFLIYIFMLFVYLSYKYRHIFGKRSINNAFIQTILIMLLFCSIFTTVLFTIRYEYYLLLYLLTLIAFANIEKKKLSN